MHISYVNNIFSYYILCLDINITILITQSITITLIIQIIPIVTTNDMKNERRNGFDGKDGKSGGGFVVGMSIISTPPGSPSTLSINNPSTAVSGGIKIDESTGALSQPLSCHLIIKKLV